MNIIDGKRIAQDIHKQQSARSAELAHGLGRKPSLAVVLVGDNPASLSYVRAKKRACEAVGIDCNVVFLDGAIDEATLRAHIEDMNRDTTIDGIIVQLPLPAQVDSSVITGSVAPDKDVDGLHPENLGKLVAGEPRFIPATPLGIQRMLVAEAIPIKGQKIVIVGRSRLVGMPLAVLLASRHADGDATVTICHRHTANLREHTRAADILIVATGQADLIGADDVRRGVVVIDVGVNRIESAESKSGYKLVGDVNFDEVAPTAKAITPVPGGVGPMTIAMLLENVLLATKLNEMRRTGLK